MKLWLVRHALPLIDPGICYGRLDMPADAGATAECARRLAAALPAGICVVTSPLQRCEQLSQALQALRPDLAAKTDARLAEMDFGRWEGRAWSAIDRAELRAWTDDFARHAAGRDGERVAGFMARVAAAFDELGSDDTLWVTHAGVIRVAGLLARGIRHLERADQWPPEATNYGQWRTLALRAGRLP